MITTSSAPSRPRVRPGPRWTVTLDVIYSGALKTDVYKQARVGCPALITLFPGAWQVGDKSDATMTSTAVSFAALGYCVFNTNYRLSGAQEVLDPQLQITDVLTIVSWVRANAATYNVNPLKVAALGKSAGGHLALMAGIQGVPGGSRPDAVIGWSPPCELGTLIFSGATAANAYMDCSYSGNEALWQSFSPTNAITSNSPPIRVVGSSAENTSGGGIQQSQFDNLHTAAVAAGVNSTKRIFSGSVHAEFDGIAQSSANDTNATDAWLRSVGII